MIDQTNIRKQMEVLGSDGQHVGTVDHMEGSDAIKLTRSDPVAQNQHHWIPMDWVSRIEGNQVWLRLPSVQAIREWQERSPVQA